MWNNALHNQVISHMTFTAQVIGSYMVPRVKIANHVLRDNSVLLKEVWMLTNSFLQMLQTCLGCLDILGYVYRTCAYGAQYIT